jgi:hypothetical protein
MGPLAVLGKGSHRSSRSIIGLLLAFVPEWRGLLSFENYLKGVKAPLVHMVHPA